MTKILILTFFFYAITLMNISFSQEVSAYKIFDKDGNETDYPAMVSSVLKNQVVLFGELHNNPISHFFQIKLTKDFYDASGKSLILAAEMFEADDQIILDEYINGKISERNFKTEAKLWNNYATDYKPLVEFAKSNGLKFIASNIPRRYASMVYAKGLSALDSLESQAYEWIVPLPVSIDLTLKSYSSLKEGMEGHKNNFLPESQAMKDATMSHFILKNINENSKIIHYNGAYHSDYFEGIYWFLKRDKPELKILTITSVEQNDVNKIEDGNLNKADFIIVIDADMTKTYESK
ncbi:MAG: ChaN family lipoprotein [Ignavibacteria bacterium]|nr:ChaN family lipoprotein [Ignavibacteria bacterium]